MEKLKGILRRRKKQFFYPDEDYTRYYEPEYRAWWTREFVQKEICALSQSGFLSSLFSLMVLAMLVNAILEVDMQKKNLWNVDAVYSAWYAVVVASVAATAARQYRGDPLTTSTKVGFLMDAVSYVYYLPLPRPAHCKIICYFIRVHRPLRFIWAADSNSMNSSLLVTALKYMYYTLLLRIVCSYSWIMIEPMAVGVAPYLVPQRRMLQAAKRLVFLPDLQAKSRNTSYFYNALYLVNKIFIPIGPPINPESDFDRVWFLLVMMMGVLMVAGATVAALSSVISIHMRHRENFRTRYRIIMRDLASSGIPISLRNRVETFYKMYWHKQQAVSATQLLPSFPPLLPKSVYTDIYFEATQKSGLLRDLSYEFLSEVARSMETILYIPGDSIIKRNSHKNSIIYITYGDIEMLTAEDDISPMLRFTRGTILSPWGLCPAGATRAHVALRAATFCAAHALHAPALWRAARTHRPQAAFMREELRVHMNKVKRHYAMRKPRPTQHKSSILEFKKSLMALKEARDMNGELLLARPDYFLEIAGCYLMRNRADATLTDDSDAICLRQTFPCILQPTSSLLTAWNWLVAGLIVVVCFTHPYYLVYKRTVPLEFRFFDLMVGVVYVLDIIVYLSTGANVEEGVPITFLQTSSLQVQSPWFVLDVLGTFPIFTFIGEGQFTGLNKILRFPKVIRVIQSLEEECVYHSNLVRFISYALMLMIACYFIAALQQVFVCYGYGYCVVSNFTHEPFWTRAPLDDETVTDRLCFSLYWAISVLTFTSHMELGSLSGNYSVHGYTFLLLEVCIVMHICIEAVYSATILVTTSFREKYDSCIVDVRNFLIRHKVAPQLRQRFIEHLQLCWNTRKAYTMASQQSTVFYDLPEHVYHDILARQRSKYILCIPFMKLLHKEDLKNVSSNARIFYIAPNEILLNTGDISTEMYVVKQGFCEVLNPETGEVVGTLVAKNNFGVLECLFRFPAFYTVRAATHVQVFSISRKYLAQALEMPQIKDAINFAKEQEEYSRLQVRREPFVTYKPPARVPTRARFRLPRKHERDAAFLQPFQKFGYFSILKNVFPRFTFRPDSELLARYELCRAFCACACALVFPPYTYMVLQFPWLYHVALVLDLSAYSDIVLRMLVGYFNEQGILVYHPANSAAHYLRGAFLMDALSCFPLESLEVSRKYAYGNLYQVTAMKQILMLNRLLQLYRLPGTLEVLTSRIERRDIILVLQALPLFLTMLNLLTSLLVFSSVRIYHSVDQLEWAFVPTDDKGGSWIYLFNKAYRFNVTESPWQLHLGCYFWVVYEATTTGYNTLAPTNLYIMAVLFGAMVFGSLITIYMSVRIISIRANVNNTLAAYQEHMKDLAEFMHREKLDKKLQTEMLEHYEYNWVKTGGVDGRNVLKLCDQMALRSDAILHLYGPAFAKCPILSDCDASLLRVLGRAVRSIHFLEGTTIFQEDDIIDRLYIVYKGRLHLRTTNWGEGTSTITRLAIGSMVGNLADAGGSRMRARLVAATNVHLLQMSSVTFHHIVRYCDYCHVVYQLIAKYRVDDQPYINADVANGWQRNVRRSSGDEVRNLYSLSSVVQVFLIVVSMLCVYTDLYNAGFQDNRESLVGILYLLDACFLLKILLYFTVTELVTLPTDDFVGAKETYFKSAEFKYDVASCVPIELLGFLSNQPWLLISWLRLNRMLRVKTVSKYLKRYQKRATENLVLSTLALVMWFTLYVHCCTCLWFFIGLTVHQAEPRSSWFYDDAGDQLCNSEYICSVYFVLTTFSQNGVSDVMPKKQIEVLYVSLLSIASTMVYVVYVGEFSNIVHYASFRAFSYYCKILELRAFLKNNRVSSVLVSMVNKYSVLLWREARGEQLPVFLVNAPFCLKLNVMSHAYMDEGKRHPVFKDCEPALLRQVVGHLRQYYYDENMYVVKQNEITNSMYLVHTGEVQEISEFEGNDGVIAGENRRLYTAGEYFGVAEGFTRDKKFLYSYRTTIKSQILTLCLDDWEYLLKHFPDSKRVIDNYQWPDDNNQPKDDKAPPLGDPGGSEIWITDQFLDPSVGPSDSPPGKLPSEPPDAPADKPSDGTSKTAPLVELKRSPQKGLSKSALKLLSRRYNAGKTAPSDISKSTQRVEQDAKGVNSKDDAGTMLRPVPLNESSDKKVGERVKSVAFSSKKTELSQRSFGEVQIEESPLFDDSNSSAKLFERIRKAALAVDMAVNQHANNNDETSRMSQTTEDSDAFAVSVPFLSVEEYLAHKYNMKESYALDTFSTKRKSENKHYDDFIKNSLCQIPISTHEVVDPEVGNEDFRHAQLADILSIASFSQNQQLNLDRLFADKTPPPATDDEPPKPLELEQPNLLQQTDNQGSNTSIIIQPDPLPLETIESQVTTSSGQPEYHTEDTPEPKNNKGSVLNIKLVDFDSDVAANMTTIPPPTELLAILPPPSGILEQNQPGSSRHSLNAKTAVLPINTPSQEQAVDQTHHKTTPTPPPQQAPDSQEPDDVTQKTEGAAGGKALTEIKMMDFDSDVAAQMAAVSGSAITLALVDPEHIALPSNQTITEFKALSLPALLAPSTPLDQSNLPAHEQTKPSEISALAEPLIPALLALPESIPDDNIEPDPSVASMHLLEQAEIPPPLVVPSEDQVTDIVDVPSAPEQLEKVNTEAPMTSKQATQQSSEFSEPTFKGTQTSDLKSESDEKPSVDTKFKETNTLDLKSEPDEEPSVEPKYKETQTPDLKSEPDEEPSVEPKYKETQTPDLKSEPDEEPSVEPKYKETQTPDLKSKPDEEPSVDTKFKETQTPDLKSEPDEKPSVDTPNTSKEVKKDKSGQNKPDQGKSDDGKDSGEKKRKGEEGK